MARRLDAMPKIGGWLQGLHVSWVKRSTGERGEKLNIKRKIYSPKCQARL